MFFSLYFFFLIFFRDHCWKPVLLLCFLLYLGVGYFIYVESSRNRPGDKARLRSPRLNGTQCMSFYYNFYGDTMSCVIAYIKTAYGSENILWIKSGHWGERWIKTQIEISEQKADYWVSISMRFFPYERELTPSVPKVCVAFPKLTRIATCCCFFSGCLITLLFSDVAIAR